MPSLADYLDLEAQIGCCTPSARPASSAFLRRRVSVCFGCPVRASVTQRTRALSSMAYQNLGAGRRFELPLLQGAPANRDGGERAFELMLSRVGLPRLAGHRNPARSAASGYCATSASHPLPAARSAALTVHGCGRGIASPRFVVTACVWAGDLLTVSVEWSLQPTSQLGVAPHLCRRAPRRQPRAKGSSTPVSAPAASSPSSSSTHSLCSLSGSHRSHGSSLPRRLAMSSA